MLFQEALQALKEGKNVKRKSWSKDEGYLSLLEGMLSIWKVIITQGGEYKPNVGNHLFTVDDLSADDWEIYSSLEEVKEKEVEVDAA